MGPVQWSVWGTCKNIFTIVDFEKALVKRKSWAGRRGGRGGRANVSTTALAGVLRSLKQLFFLYR